MGAEVRTEKEPVTINPHTGQSSDFKGHMMFYEERFNPKPKKEKIDKPGTVLSRAWDKLVGKLKKNEEKKEVTVETKKLIEGEKLSDMPKKDYDLKKAIDHFQSLSKEDQDFVCKFFNINEKPGTGKDPYKLFDEVYKFQTDKKLAQDGMAGKEVRSKIKASITF